MMRARLKSLAAAGMHLSGAAWLIGRLNGRGREPLVLCYHRVVGDLREHPESAPAMLVSTATLERQLDWIGRRYRFATLDQVAAWYQDPTAAAPRSRPLAAVTFDDGYADVYHHAFPMLMRKGIPAACFVVTGAIDRELELPHDLLYGLLRYGWMRLGRRCLLATLGRLGAPTEVLTDLGAKPPAQQLVELNQQILIRCSRDRIVRLIADLGAAIGEVEPGAGGAEPVPMMTWPMLAEMGAAGLTIGSHTRSHRILPVEPPQAAFAELLESRRTLERRLGVEVAHLAYPNGQFCAATVRAAHRAGYRSAFTTCGHRDPHRPALTIPRRCFWERSTADAGGSFRGAIAACETQGVFELLRPCRGDHERPSPTHATDRGAFGATASSRSSSRPVAVGARSAARAPRLLRAALLVAGAPALEGDEHDGR